MEVPSDPARRALLRAIEAWSDSSDARTLAQMDERVRPSEQTRERSSRAAADLKRCRALMLEAIESFAAECKQQGAADEDAARNFQEANAELQCWGCHHALCVHTAGELGDECTECQCVAFETAPAECELAGATVKP